MGKVHKERPKRRQADDTNRDDNVADISFSFGGLLGKLGGVIEKLADLAETGETLTRSGEIKGLDPKGKVRGVYGFSLRTNIGGEGGQEIKIEPFGNIHQESSGDTVVDEVREPLVDLYEEEDHVLVLAEIPGVSKEDVKLELANDLLTIRAQRGEKRYCKEVTLPEEFSEDKMHWECANGILKIRFEH